MRLVLIGRCSILCTRGIVKWKWSLNDEARFDWQVQHFYAPADIVKWNSIATVNRRLRGRANAFHALADTFGALQEHNVKCQPRGTTHLL